MADAFREDRPLAPLRDDLEISPGAPFLSGAPGWVIRDPVRHRFFQIGQRTIDVLSRWSAGSVDRLKARLFSERAIALSDDEIEGLNNFLRQNQLLEGGERGTARHYARLKDRSPIARLWLGAQKLMFIRVPLVRPERYLQATWPTVRPLFSSTFVWISLLVLCAAVYLASRQLADIEAHIRQAFSWTGVAVFFLAIAIVKMLHELGHAYQAIGRGLRVPVMGVAFFAFLPLLYTDTTDAWRLRRRGDRVMVDMGGVLVELTVAVYATLTWCFLPDGPARTIAFAVATSSWVLSLLVNLNPLMRFDGYYLLSDSLGIQNLHPRATAMGKWAMRRWLFGIDDPAPENLDRRTRRFLIGFAYSVWIYRLFLFLAISVLVYSLFFKLAGVALLVVSVSAFIVKPVLAEVLFWISARKRILKSTRAWVTFSIFAVLLAFLFWPMSTRVYVPAVLAEARQQAIFPPQAGLLEAVFVSEGDLVAQGDPLFQFADPELPQRIRQSETRIAMYKARLLSAAGDATERAEGTVVARMLEEENQNLTALAEQKANLVVTAAIDGEVRELSTELDVGTWYARTEFLGRIVQEGALAVRGFINETDLERLDQSREAEFVADELTVPVMRLERIEVSDFAIDRLSEGYLSRPNGGEIAVTENDAGGSVVAGVWYPVTGVPVANTGSGGLTDKRVLRGTIIMHSKLQAYATRIGNRVARVLVRELEF